MDVINLEQLMAFVYNPSVASTPFGSQRQLVVPQLGKHSFKADPNSIGR